MTEYSGKFVMRVQDFTIMYVGGYCPFFCYYDRAVVAMFRKQVAAEQWCRDQSTRFKSL